MDFTRTERCEELLVNLREFVEEHVHPVEEACREECVARPYAQAPTMLALQADARRRGLWNLFYPDPVLGAGLSNVEYAPLAEMLGRSPIASEVCNCSPPDTGNMELLTLFGSEEQRRRWLAPLLEAEIRSAFAMTEPGVASSDATNVQLTISRNGGEYVLDGRKWWTSGVLHPNCRVLIVMGKTDREASPYHQQSMVLVPLDTPGVEVVRDLSVFGYQDGGGHGEVAFNSARVPAANLLGEEGGGFAMSQARLGPGRIHHAMRAIGAAERAFDLMCERVEERETFGRLLSSRDNVRSWIAESRIELEMARLLVLKAAWLMDTVGNKEARVEIAAIKVAAPAAALRVVDRAIQLFGGAGISQDTPLARSYAQLRTLRIADGPDEVHLRTIARTELERRRRAEA